MNIKDNWNLILGITLPLILFVSSFFYYPAYIEDESVFKAFGRWVVVIIVGLMLIPMSKWKLKRHVPGWIIATCIFLLIAICGFFLSRNYEQEWTCKCEDGKVVVIGSRPDIKPSVRRGLELTIKQLYINESEEKIQQRVEETLKECAYLLNAKGCKPGEIWSLESINKNKLLLGVFYVSFLPFFILAMMSMLQAATPYLNRFINENQDN